MDLTHSYERTINAEVLSRYEWCETRNAAVVLAASNPDEFDDLTAVLTSFYVYDSDLLVAGGNRGQIPIRIDAAFAALGWSAVRVNMSHTLEGKRKLNHLARAYDETFVTSTVSNEGFEVDNFKGRVAIDVEWNAKDGNLDRDLSAYRALYEMGLIDAAAIITRDHAGIRNLAKHELASEDAFRRLGTTTTTNIEKLRDRMVRGDSGGCPVLAIGITHATWAGKGKTVPTLADPAGADLEG